VRAKEAKKTAGAWERKIPQSGTDIQRITE